MQITDQNKQPPPPPPPPPFLISVSLEEALYLKMRRSLEMLH